MSERLVPLRDRLEIRADEPLDVVADRRRQLGRVLDDEPGPAVERAPDAERDGESVAALDRRGRPGSAARSVARGPAVSIRWHDSGMPFQSSSADRLALGHPRSEPEQQPADAVRRLAGRVFERRQLLDLVRDAQAVAGVDQQVGRVLDEARRARSAGAARRR